MRYVGTAARAGFFVLEIAALTMTEMGIIRQLSAEVMCDFAVDSSHDISDAAVQTIEYTGYVVWGVCIPLFVASRFRSSWNITNLAHFKDRFISVPDFYSLSTLQKMIFIGFMAILLVGHYTMSALTKYVGVYYMLRSILSLSKATAEIVAGLTTFILATVSFGFSVPDCLHSVRYLVTQFRFPRSYLVCIALMILGLGVSGASIDYLMRFLETKNQVILNFIPALLIVGVIEFLYPILTSGSTLRLMPQLKTAARNHPAFAGLLGMSALCWWPMNAHQLGSGMLQLVYNANDTMPASTEIRDICLAVATNRHGSMLVRIWVFIAAGGITLVSTTFFEIYQFSKTLNLKASAQDPELSSLLFTSAHRGVATTVAENDQLLVGSDRVTPPFLQVL